MKTALRVIIILIVFLILGGVGFNYYLKHRINSALEKQVKSEHLSYADFHLDLWTGSFSFDSISYQKDGSQIFAQNLSGVGFSYVDYWKNKTVSLKSLTFNYPKIKYEQSDSSTDSTPNNKNNFPSIKIEETLIKNANFQWIKDSIQKLSLENYSIDIQQLDLKPEAGSLTYDYGNFKINGGLLSLDMGKLQRLEIDSIISTRRGMSFEQLKILPKYSRQKYTQAISHEMDLMDIIIGQVELQNYNFDFKSAHGGLTAKKLFLNQVNAHIYRDKTMPDDPGKKELYSGMLRKLKFKLDIDSLFLNNTNVTYEEVQEKTGETGEISFNDMSVVAAPITNVDLDRKDFPETKIDISCKMMKTSPFKVNWRFKVNDSSDNFHIKGAIHKVPTSSANAFFIPAFYMKLEGDSIDDLYFDFYGDKYTAQGNYKMHYKHLKIDILKEKTKEKKGFVSFITNLFVKHKNTPQKEEVKVENVKRDPTKSFWNYLWQCVFSGLKGTIAPIAK